MAWSGLCIGAATSAVCAECMWFAWNALCGLCARRQPSDSRGPPQRQPLLVVMFMSGVASTVQRAWIMRETDATIYRVLMDKRDEVYSNLWVWRRPSVSEQPRHATHSILSKVVRCCRPLWSRLQGYARRALHVTPAAAIGAARYARRLESASVRRGTMVACLEDPDSFSVHQMHPFPALSTLGWERMCKLTYPFVYGDDDADHSRGKNGPRCTCAIPPLPLLMRTATTTHTAAVTAQKGGGAFSVFIDMLALIAYMSCCAQAQQCGRHSTLPQPARGIPPTCAKLARALSVDCANHFDVYF